MNGLRCYLSRSYRLLSLLLREQEVRSSNLRAPTIVFSNLAIVISIAGFH